MLIEKCEKKSFVVIGKEGSTKDGADFINKLWLDANSHFGEVRHLAKKDASGNIVGIWGVMSDFYKRTISCGSRMRRQCGSPRRVDEMGCSELRIYSGRA